MNDLANDIATLCVGMMCIFLVFAFSWLAIIAVDTIFNMGWGWHDKVLGVVFSNVLVWAHTIGKSMVAKS